MRILVRINHHSRQVKPFGRSSASLRALRSTGPSRGLSWSFNVIQ